MKHDLSLFQRISYSLSIRIKGKLGIAFIGFATIPILIIGLILWYINLQSLQESALERLSHLSKLINIRLVDLTRTVYSDLQTVVEEFDDPDPEIYQDSNALVWKKHHIFNTMKVKSQYYRITMLVDSLRGPLLSIERSPLDGDSLFESEREYSWEYYKVVTGELKQDQMRLTPVEYFDPISGQTIPAFSFALPYHNETGNMVGIYVADLFADRVFSLIETSLKEEPQYTAGIVDRDGKFLYHSTRKLDWNRLLAESTVRTLKEEFTKEITTNIIGQNSGIIVAENRDIIYHMPLTMGSSRLNQNYYFYLVEPRSVYYSAIIDMGIVFAVSIAVVILVALFLTRVATIQFISPIQKLHTGANKLASGDFTHRIRVKTGDEIEMLAEQFNFMAESIEDRDRELKNINTRLETKVKERTEELEEEKNKLRIVLDNVPSAFVLISKDEIILTASRALKQLTGFDPEEVIGRKCGKTLGSILDCDDCFPDSPESKGEIRRYEKQVVLESSKVKTFELIMAPVTLTSGENACLEIISDITERIRLQNKLLQSEKLASIGELASVIAHEIRNSLTSAKILLQLIQESTVIKKEDKDSLDVVLSSVSRINNITSDLLMFSRPARLKRSRTALLIVIENALKANRPLLDSLGINVSLEVCEELPIVNIDMDNMMGVFNNILINSSQAINGKGMITIKGGLIKPPESVLYKLATLAGDDENGNISEEKYSELIYLQFFDTGPGIDNDIREKIFDPFFTTKINGTGLGLAMAKRVVEAHGGVIQLGSGAGQNAAIEIFLPVK